MGSGNTDVQKRVDALVTLTCRYGYVVLAALTRQSLGLAIIHTCTTCNITPKFFLFLFHIFRCSSRLVCKQDSMVNACHDVVIYCCVQERERREQLRLEERERRDKIKAQDAPEKRQSEPV